MVKNLNAKNPFATDGEDTALLAASGSAAANSTKHSDEFVILAPKGGIAGNSVNNWTQQWWDWAVQNGMPSAGLSDSGKMTFLGGSWGGSVTNNHVDVQSGTPILVPVFNTLLTGFNGSEHTYPGTFEAKSFATGTPAAVNDGFADAWKASITNIYLKVDGTSVDLSGDFAKSSWFNLDLGGGSEIPKCQSDGYWAILSGLSQGTHTIEFGGSSAAFDFAGTHFTAFSVDVKDTVHVS